MIGIIGAMDEEVKKLREMIQNGKVVKKAGMEFFCGTLGKREVVVVHSGIGKVNAAICTQILVDCFGIEGVINTGIAGSLKSESIKNARNKSICIKIMTKYALRFTDSFPGFIENDVKRYVISQREKEVINDVLHDYENPEPDKFEKSKEIN